MPDGFPASAGRIGQVGPADHQRSAADQGKGHRLTEQQGGQQHAVDRHEIDEDRSLRRPDQLDPLKVPEKTDHGSEQAEVYDAQPGAHGEVKRFGEAAVQQRRKQKEQGAGQSRPASSREGVKIFMAVLPKTE